MKLVHQICESHNKKKEKISNPLFIKYGSSLCEYFSQLDKCILYCLYNEKIDLRYAKNLCDIARENVYDLSKYLIYLKSVPNELNRATMERLLKIMNSIFVNFQQLQQLVIVNSHQIEKELQHLN
jgi:hypothetical protein